MDQVFVIVFASLCYFGLVRKISYEIFDLEANVPEAFDYCKANGMGSPNASPFTYMYVRARPQNRPLLTPIYYPSDATSFWYDVNRCVVYRRNDGLLTSWNAIDTCAKIVMDPSSEYVWEPVNCSTRLPFMCNKGHNILFTSNETYVGKQIDRNVTGVVFSVFENKTTPLDCETHCLNAARTCIAVEVLQINESYWVCTAAQIHFQEFIHSNMSVQMIELIPAPDNFTVYVKGLNQSDEGNFNYNFPTTTLAPNCSCVCSFHNYTDAELQAWIDKLKSELLLNKRALSSNARKKISASDPRASSQAIGSLGALIGFLVAFPEVLMAISVVTGGILIDKLIATEKVTTTEGRKIAQCTGFGIESLCLLSLYIISDYRIATAVLLVGIGISGLAISGYQVNVLDLAPQYAHIVTGFTRISCIGSVLSTLVAGSLRQEEKDLGFDAGRFKTKQIHYEFAEQLCAFPSKHRTCVSWIQRSSDDVWIGMIKHANSNFWYPTMHALTNVWGHGIIKEEGGKFKTGDKRGALRGLWWIQEIASWGSGDKAPGSSWILESFSYQQHNDKFDVGIRPRTDSLFTRHPNNDWYFHFSKHFRASDLSMPLYLSNDVQHFNGRSSAENNSDQRKPNCRQNFFIVIPTEVNMCTG
uniref:Vesicular glutamate transporter 3 n=1 Tax=Magallana gigas TaxID=29159 RepID=K1QJ30_MAGGI